MSPFSFVFSFVFPLLATAKLQGFDIPIERNLRRAGQTLNQRGELSGSIGLGNNADLLYTVPVEFGSTATAVHLDTGSSDLWVITDTCRGGTCDGATSHRYPSASLKSSGTDVAMHYGDSTTGTNATGAVALETVTIAGIAVEDQPFGAIDYTSNAIVKYATAGIMGLGFPSGSKVQESLVTDKIGQITDTEPFIESTSAWGPPLARIVMSDELADPMFAISLQRNTIDIGGGTGTLSVGKLPDGIDKNAVTWVPVRRYTAKEGGLRAPSSLPDEVYPFRWELDIDGVFLDGKRLPDSTVPTGDGVDAKRNSALIDTGNSILRGPSDVVANIMSTLSGKPDKTMPCAIPHTLSFQIGGKMFPIDPRDLIGQHLPNDATTCVADNLVSTDAPRYGALFRWSLGDPFFRSNLVAFHYGDLEQPSLDPPMIGLLSMVPPNADDLLRQAVQDAVNNGGNFESTLQVAPTAQAAADGQTTVVPKSADLDLLKMATTPLNNNPAPPVETDPPSSSNKENTKDNAAFPGLGLHLGYSIGCLISVSIGMLLL